MKHALDPRHLKRIEVVQELFAHSFAVQNSTSVYTKRVLESLAEVDRLIEDTAPQYPLDKIAKIDLAVLRLAVYELVIDKKEPLKVIIDEAVEIAKIFGNEKSSSFVNGVLGTIIEKKYPNGSAQRHTTN